MPNKPATQNRSIRFPPTMWADVERIAADLHVTKTEIVLRAVAAYVRRYPAQ